MVARWILTVRSENRSCTLESLWSSGLYPPALFPPSVSVWLTVIIQHKAAQSEAVTQINEILINRLWWTEHFISWSGIFSKCFRVGVTLSDINQCDLTSILCMCVFPWHPIIHLSFSMLMCCIDMHSTLNADCLTVNINHAGGGTHSNTLENSKRSLSSCFYFDKDAAKIYRKCLLLDVFDA